MGRGGLWRWLTSTVIVMGITVFNAGPVLADPGPVIGDVSIGYHNNSSDAEDWFNDLIYPLTPDEMPLSQVVDVTAGVTDSTGTAVAGEYYVDTDPGVGSGSTTGLYVDSGSINLDDYQPVSTGTHTIGLRVKDSNNVWSSTKTFTLEVVSNTYQRIEASGTIVPGGSSSDSGDNLVGLNGTTTANISSAVYRQANDIDNFSLLGPVTLSYHTGTCGNTGIHCMDFTSVMDGESQLMNGLTNFPSSGVGVVWGEMEGTIDGSVHPNWFLFKLEISSASSHVNLKLWDEGDPNYVGYPDIESVTPTYQASGNLSGSVNIQYVPGL